MSEIKTVQRLYTDRVFKGLVCIFAGLTAIPLLAILGEVLMRGCGLVLPKFLGCFSASLYTNSSLKPLP